MRTLTHYVGQHDKGVYLIQCVDPTDANNCSISVWYDPDTLRCTRIHRHGKRVAGIGRNGSAIRARWDEFVVTTVACARLTAGDARYVAIDVDVPID